MKCWWKIHIGKTELQNGRMYCDTVLNITHFSHPLWTLLYIASENCYILLLNTVMYCVRTLLYIASQKVRKYHFQYKYIFYDQDHIRWISNFYYNYAIRKLNSLSLRFPHQNPVHTSPLPIWATSPSHLILLDFITQKILGEDYRSLCFSLCCFSIPCYLISLRPKYSPQHPIL